MNANLSSGLCGIGEDIEGPYQAIHFTPSQKSEIARTISGTFIGEAANDPYVVVDFIEWLERFLELKPHDLCSVPKSSLWERYADRHEIMYGRKMSEREYEEMVNARRVDAETKHWKKIPHADKTYIEGDEDEIAPEDTIDDLIGNGRKYRREALKEAVIQAEKQDGLAGGRGFYSTFTSQTQNVDYPNWFQMLMVRLFYKFILEPDEESSKVFDFFQKGRDLFVKPTGRALNAPDVEVCLPNVFEVSLDTEYRAVIPRSRLGTVATLLRGYSFDLENCMDYFPMDGINSYAKHVRGVKNFIMDAFGPGTKEGAFYVNEYDTWRNTPVED
jgi:hypothetical protein